VFRSSIGRVAALYTVLFALSVVALGLVTLQATRAAMAEIYDASIQAESLALAQEYRAEGLVALLLAVRDRDRTPGAMNYGLEGPGYRPLAGRLSIVKAPVGWSIMPIQGQHGVPERIRILTMNLPDGHRLLVGAEEDRIEALDVVVLRSFAWAFVGVVILGVAGGYGLSRDVHRRLAAISGTAEAIIDGDLARRVPVRGSSDDLDRLALTFNRMLDRISALMESLRQVSNDIAHDMRTPLTRLRQHLESSLGEVAEADRAPAIEAALGELDAILETFSALLRIAQIESGARRAGFRPTDVAALAATVVEAFAPSAEEGRRALRLVAGGPLWIEGDRELLTQMLVNLVENALRHTPSGANIAVEARRAGDDVVLSVADDGPGVPAAERDKLFDRFYRLETARSAPGNGLGLALVAAVAKLHGAEVKLADAAPGLEARIVFPGAGAGS
jgi:signal transduction histidine kinase